MSQDIGLQLLKAASKADLPFTIWYSDDCAERGDEPAYHGTSWRTGWSEATACDDATVTFGDDSWAYMIHGNEPDETVNDYSTIGHANDLMDQIGGASC